MLNSKDKFQLYKGDCLEIMKNIESNSVNLVLIDPPYNINKDKKWDKWKTVDAYVEFMGQVFLECQRVLKNNGSFYFFHNDFLQIVELQNYINKNTDFIFKQFLVWNKRFEGGRLKGYLDAHCAVSDLRNYKQMAEYCLFYTFQDETGLNKIYDSKDCFYTIKQYLKEEKKKSGYSNKQLSLLFSQYTNKTGCLNRSVIEHYFQNTQWCFPTKDIYENVLQKTGFFQRPYESLRQEYESLRQEYESLRYTFNNQKNIIQS